MAQYSGLFLNFSYGVVGKNRKTVFGHSLVPVSTNRRFLEIDPHSAFSVIGAKSGIPET